MNTPEEGPHSQKRFHSPVNFFHVGFINLHPPGCFLISGRTTEHVQKVL